MRMGRTMRRPSGADAEIHNSNIVNERLREITRDLCKKVGLLRLGRADQLAGPQMGALRHAR